MTDIVERLNDSLSAGYDSLSAGYSELRKEAAEEIMRLRAKTAPSVPDGWKLVPIEPTTDMICEMERQWMCGSQIDMAKREWKAACAAAPEAKP